MPRYIDAEKAEKIMHCMDMQDLYLPVHFKEMVLDETQTEDVVPVRHGHWFFVECSFFHCSVCGDCVYNGCETRAEAERMLREHITCSFCPNCGAKMDEEDG